MFSFLKNSKLIVLIVSFFTFLLSVERVKYFLQKKELDESNRNSARQKEKSKLNEFESLQEKDSEYFAKKKETDDVSLDLADFDSRS